MMQGFTRTMSSALDEVAGKGPRVSVITPCFNLGEFLPEAVSSVTSIGRDDVELIIVDDGSTDERTRNEMERLRAEGIRVIRQENNGPGAARNTGILASRGEYIFPLDADDRLRSDWIDRGIKALDSDSTVGVVYGDAQCFGNRTTYWRTGPFDEHRLLMWNYIHVSALYRRSAWEQNGGYDDAMLIQGLEDWDFWLGALERGWRFVYIPEAFFEYRQREQSMVNRPLGHEGEIREFVARKHGVLYREAWSKLERERRSIKASSRNLAGLLKARLKSKLHDDGRDGHSDR